jgi:beta-phosphoglucomutase-like phosphatase (HAD superfamily)
MPDNWTIQRAAAFMRDLARECYDLPVILGMHKVSQAQYDKMKVDETFKRTLEAMSAEWHSASNTPKRLALESLILLEDALPTVAARLTKQAEPLPGVVELAKLLAKLGGVGDAAQNNTPSERFKITINLGADTLQRDATRSVITVETPNSEPLPALPEGT